ncbi:MAG: Uma2 family endonuclease [Leptolyngbyaceae cyanobacterium RU_5_1]|nr:Uma2 family endonuclease [Leptolyngbyaceae cyanobacterium RU_5_1]
MLEPSDLNEELIRFLDEKFSLEIRRLKHKWTTRRRRSVELDAASGHRPDLAVIERPEPVTDSVKGIQTVPHLLVETVSPNWSSELKDKQEAYQALGVTEFWIIDYAGRIPPSRYSHRGNSKKVVVLTRTPTGEYQRNEYIGAEIVPCKTFPDIKLTANQIISGSE